MSRELIYLLLIFGLLVIPRVLQRLKIPAPITALLLGVGAMLAFGEETQDPVVVLLSTLGISSLFLFAGLEVDTRQLRQGIGPLLMHLAIRLATLAGVAWLAWAYLGLGWQPAALVALALLTPSTGFILDTLERLGLDQEERFWVTSKAIAGELLALGALFFVLLADDPVQLGISSAAMVGLVVGLPFLFIALGRWVMPHAPGSEFSLLVMVGLVAAYVTYKLGVYYLTGAFVAGLAARLLHTRIPKLASDDNLHALRLFATFFVPFYFFHAGTEVSRAALSWEALGMGVALTAVVVPLRIGIVWIQRRMVFGKRGRSNLRVAVALAPTLVFTLVLAHILQTRFAVDDALIGALILYTVINTMLPSLLLRAPFDIDPLDDRNLRHPEDALPAAAEAPRPPPPEGVEARGGAPTLRD